MLARVPWTPTLKVAPQRKPRQFSSGRRKHLVYTTATVLRQWKSSCFEFEASCRHGLRAGLCLEGWGWQEADKAAQDIVAIALRQIGAQRPSWKEGQPEWAQDGFAPIERVTCLRCGVVLPEGHRKFCSTLCTASHYEWLARQTGERMSRAEWLSSLAASKEKTQLKYIFACEECGKPFTAPNFNACQRYCSQACGHAATGRLLRRPERTCPTCKGAFQPAAPGQVYCTSKCFGGRDRPLIEATCTRCRSIFTAKSGKATYCSNRCRLAESRLRIRCEAAE